MASSSSQRQMVRPLTLATKPRRIFTSHFFESVFFTAAESDFVMAYSGHSACGHVPFWQVIQKTQ